MKRYVRYMVFGLLMVAVFSPTAESAQVERSERPQRGTSLRGTTVDRLEVTPAGRGAISGAAFMRSGQAPDWLLDAALSLLPLQLGGKTGHVVDLPEPLSRAAADADATAATSRISELVTSYLRLLGASGMKTLPPLIFDAVACTHVSWPAVMDGRAPEITTTSAVACPSR